jgi:glucose/arabinose dehydrogenase
MRFKPLHCALAGAVAVCWPLGGLGFALAGDGTITTIGGSGIAGYAGDGGSATSAALYLPIRAVSSPGGSILIADEANNAIREIRLDGTIRTIAGVGGTAGFAGDGGPATAALLHQPTGVSPLPDGGFLIADRSNNRIRRVSANGVISTVAGSGVACGNPASACGDGGLAVAAQLNAPDRAAPLADGGFLITEDEGHKVRRVMPNGTIVRVAGNGLPCLSATAACGDGGPAISARLNAPNGIATLPDGGFIISDSNDNRIRAVSATGVITTIAGNGVAGSWGDNIPAVNANLNSPSSVAVAPDGTIVVADSWSHLVRTIKNGVIHTLAGVADVACPSSTSTCGDGGPATAAKLYMPFDVSVTPDGYVLIADHRDNKVRRVNSTLGGSPTVAVRGRQLVNGVGQPVQLRGVNRAIFESRCTYDGSGFADGPADQASVAAMLTWKMTTVRVTLNEDCWLGINGLPVGGNAAGYRAAATAYVQLLRQNGLYVILEAHMSAPGANRSTQIDYMPDADHMPSFWQSVAATFKSDHGIIFDPINEVAMASWNNPNPSPSGQWACWRNGCTLDSVYGGRFVASGLQSLLNAIRSQGATQPIVLGGLSYNSDLSQLLAYLPADPQSQLIASAHVYDFAIGSGVDNLFTGQLEPIAARIPVIIGELGERYCDSGAGTYTSHVLSLINGEAAKGNLMGVLGWTWNAKTAISTGWACPTGPYGEGGPLLIRDYTGKPTVMGGVLGAWLAAKAGAP